LDIWPYPTNFNWVIEDKLAGCGIPTSLREIKWLAKEHGIRSIITIKEKPLSSKWFEGSDIGERPSTENNTDIK